MLTDIPNGRGVGQWMRVLVDEFGDHPRWGAMVWCPTCAKPLAVVQHAIDANGCVSPSVGHPLTYPPCPWHPPGVKLLGWDKNPPLPEPLPFHECARCHAKDRQLGGWGTWSGGGIICPECFKEVNGGRP